MATEPINKKFFEKIEALPDAELETATLVELTTLSMETFKMDGAVLTTSDPFPKSTLLKHKKNPSAPEVLMTPVKEQPEAQKNEQPSARPGSHTSHAGFLNRFSHNWIERFLQNIKKHVLNVISSMAMWTKFKNTLRP